MFKKGYTPWNKGMKGFKTSGTFPKGIVPWNKGKKTGHAPWKGKKRPTLKKTKAFKTMFKESRTPWNKGMSGKYSVDYRGKKNHMWKGGITPINKKIRRSLEFKFWREAVFMRDNYTCQICGERGGTLHPNHIKKFSDYPKLRFKTLNGITLCEGCHVGLVNNHERNWRSYFNFNLETRGYTESDFIPLLCKGVMPGAE